MKYYTKELWLGINSDDADERRAAEQQWAENDRLYTEQHERVASCLPKAFLKQYIHLHGFHDFWISGVTVKSCKAKKCRCELELWDGTEQHFLLLDGVSRFQISVESFASCIIGELRWGYAEWDRTPEGNFCLSVLCDFDNELCFEFKKIRLT